MRVCYVRVCVSACLWSGACVRPCVNVCGHGGMRLTCALWSVLWWLTVAFCPEQCLRAGACVRRRGCGCFSVPVCPCVCARACVCICHVPARDWQDPGCMVDLHVPSVPHGHSACPDPSVGPRQMRRSRQSSMAQRRTQKCSPQNAHHNVCLCVRAPADRGVVFVVPLASERNSHSWHAALAR